MDVSLRTRAEQLASEIASQAKTAEDLNGLMRLMMKAALERMLNSEMDVHLGRKTLVLVHMLLPPDDAWTEDKRQLAQTYIRNRQG